MDAVLGIGEFIKKTARQLSLGQRMSADLAVSVIRNPEILFLDKPAMGFDVFVKEKVRQFIKTVNKERGSTVILTTHDIGDIVRRIYDKQLVDLKFDCILNM